MTKLMHFVCFFVMTLSCQSIWTQDIRIDHVVMVIENYDESVEHYTKMGFTVKKGRQHKNGIINGFIKFENKSYLELLSIRGKPKDSLAHFYQKFIGEGKSTGAFLALTGIKTPVLIDSLKAKDLRFKLDNYSTWNIVSFPNVPGLEHIFFIDYKEEFEDSSTFHQHENAAYSFGDVILEGNTTTIALLEALGLAENVQKNGKKSKSFSTNTGQLNIKLKLQSNRPSILEASMVDVTGREVLRLNF